MVAPYQGTGLQDKLYRSELHMSYVNVTVLFQKVEWVQQEHSTTSCQFVVELFHGSL